MSQMSAPAGEGEARDMHDMLATAGGHWGMMMVFALLTLAAGILAVVWPGHALYALAVIFGVQLLVVGGYEFVHAFATHDAGLKMLRILLAAIAVFAGILVLRHPFETLALMVLVLGVLWTVSGLVNTFSALTDRGAPHRGMAVTSGVISFIAGVVLLSYPINSAFALALLLGIMLIVVGALGAAGSLELRAATHHPREKRHHRGKTVPAH
jgi:uncharacterized membrane protein HdeD (DUF308 family)